jgi:hypothetical protein
VVQQGECRAKGADAAGPVHGIDIERARGTIPRSCCTFMRDLCDPGLQAMEFGPYPGQVGVLRACYSTTTPSVTSGRAVKRPARRA